MSLLWSLVLVGVFCGGTAHAALGNKLSEDEAEIPGLPTKEWDECGRRFIARGGYNKETGINHKVLYLDGEAVCFYVVFDDPEKCWNERFMKGVWKNNFGSEEIESTKREGKLTIWLGRNGSRALFGSLKRQDGKEVGYVEASSAKMKVVRDKYYEAQLAKIPAPKQKEQDEGPRITFGGKKRDRGTGQLRVVGGSVYDGPEYIGYTSGDYIYINK